MATQGGFGSTILIAAGTAGSGTAIAHVMDFEFPEFEKILADVTAHDSPSGYAEFIATGKRQLNSFKITLLWDDSAATHTTIIAAFGSDSPYYLTCKDPDGQETIAFWAHVSKLGRISKQEEGLSCEVEIQPTGVPSVT